ncbi:MAG: DUF4446 family protein [Anaerolineales bacterium]|nr:DUF4446 family protein [Anaerolineales bacterium]
MQTLWAEHGFYLWALTTALVIVALIWLGWNAFIQASEAEIEEVAADASPEFSALVQQLSELTEGMPLMQASLGRSLQFVGLERYVDTTGAPAFALAVANGRGDGFVLSSSAHGGLTAKLLRGWNSTAALSAEEQLAVTQAREQWVE